MSFDARRLTTAGELKALAHPLRLAITERLSLAGPMTATELADDLDDSPANCSWHLRKLAEHGLVEETHDGHGRRRPWRVKQLGMTWDEATDDPSMNAAGQALTERIIAREVERFWRNRAAQGTDEWNLGAVQNATWMTPQEAAQWHSDLVELSMRYRERIENPDERPADARLVYSLGLSSVEPEAKR